VYDFLIIGGGVVGTFIARELSHYEGKTLLLEKESDLSQVQTTHNSALVHPPAMIPPEKGELKSRLARQGNEIYQTVAAKFDVPVNKGGAFLIAKNEAEIETLLEIEKAARERGIDEVRYLSKEELLAKEPNLNDEIAAGLEMPSGMSADTSVLTKKIAANAVKNGAEIVTGEKVRSIEFEDDVFTVKTESGKSYQSRYVLNAAGAHNETIARMIEEDPPYRMRPHRGEYMVLDASEKNFMRHIIYPLPSKKGKGILIIPQPDGTTRLGPTSTYQESVDDTPLTEEGAQEIRSEIASLAKNVPFDKVYREYSGVRSSINQDDFYIRASKEYPSFIHVAGIDSPGVTSSPAIAKYVVEEIIIPQEPLQKKENVYFYDTE
jgi:glycerol-3-phosphate dehydrogenase